MKSPGSTPRRPRRRRIVVVTLASVVALMLLGVAGISWYFSGVALAVDHSTSYPNTATMVGGDRVRISTDHYAVLPGTYGLEWKGGYASVGPVVATDATSVTRAFTAVTGTLAPGTPVDLDSFAYRGDPRTALGLEFEDVAIHGPLGDYPAWYLPPAMATEASSTPWVIFVHGHDSNRQESLRYLSFLHGRGIPVLVPTYRNDVGAPRSPDGFDHLGDTEWRDVDAAIGWAVRSGATGVILAGWSMGGAISLQLADRSAHADQIVGLVLDSPVVNWRDVFVSQGASRGLPEPLTLAATWVVERRAGLSLSRFDWVARAKELRRPVLLFDSDADTYVPDGPAAALARARPDLVKVVTVPGAEHCREWNVDRSSYEKALGDWLTQTAGA